MNLDKGCLDIIEVYSTEKGSVNQCNKSNRMLLEFAGLTTSFKINEFMDFCKKIAAADIEKLLTDSSHGADITIISPIYSERCFVLDLNDLINLKELLEASRAMILLNSMIRSCMLQYS